MLLTSKVRFLSLTFQFELVLPCYNESKSLINIVSRVVRSAEQFGLNPQNFRLTLVQNGSTDDSLEIMERLKCSDYGPWFQVVDVPTNQGYGHGIWSGLICTTAPIIGWSHADQQCDPLDAFKAFSMILGANKQSALVLVKGTRSGRNLRDVFVSRVFESIAQWILGFKVHEMNAQPKVFSRALLAHMTNPPKNFAFDLYALYTATKVGFEIRTIPVVFPPRIHGASKWAYNFLSRYRTIFGMIKYMFELATTEGRIRK